MRYFSICIQGTDWNLLRSYFAIVVVGDMAFVLLPKK